MTVGNEKVEIPDLSVIDVNRFNDSYIKLRVTCRVKSAFQCKSLKGMLKKPVAEDIEDAELMWIREMLKDMTHWGISVKRLSPMIEKKLIVVGQRISKLLKENWDQENFVLTPANHPQNKSCRN